MLPGASQAHTRAMIALLKRHPLAPFRRQPGRPPAPIPPHAIEREYAAAIAPVVQRAALEFGHVRGEVLRLHGIYLRRTGGQRADADPPPVKTPPGPEGREAQLLVARAAKRATDAFRPHDLHQVARQFGKRTTDYQRQQLDHQLRAAIGVGFGQIEKRTRDRLEEFAAGNVALVKTVPERYFDRLQVDVERAFTTGESTDTLSQSLAERYDMAMDDARRIARDQVGKLNAQVNQDRQEALGVEGYFWRTVRDQRVREEHAEREGQFFRWDDPPEDGHPGEAVQCRCYAEPDVAPLLAE